MLERPKLAGLSI